MKNLYSILMLIILCSVVSELSGQTNGKVIYTVTTSLDIQTDGDISQFSDALPKEITSEKELLFTKDASIYQKMESDADISEMMDDEDQGIIIMIEEPNDIFYADLNKRETVEQKEFMSRQFLIKGEMHENAWKLSGNQKVILNYPCQEATTERDNKPVTAWFTPGIPVSAGPDSFAGLPGLILEVDIDDGQRLIIAKSLVLNPEDTDKIVRPHKGKKVSQEAYDSIVAEKLEEQGGEAGKGRMMMIEIKE